MPSDPNRAAALTVKLATEKLEGQPDGNLAISQYMATIGKKGGIKGGKARAEVLSAAKRKEIARKAAQARWKDSAK